MARRVAAAPANDAGAVISRYLVIALAFIASGFRLAQGAWLEATGLAALGLGLSFLKAAEHSPAVRPLAWISFAVTAIVIAVVLVRMYF